MSGCTQVQLRLPLGLLFSAGLVALCNAWKKVTARWGVGLISRVASDRTRGDYLKLCRGRLGLLLGNISLLRVTMQWNSLPKEVVGSPSLEVYKIHADVALRDMV